MWVVVLEVNGQNVASKYLEDVILLIEGGKFLSLIVTEQHSAKILKSI